MWNRTRILSRQERSETMVLVAKKRKKFSVFHKAFYTRAVIVLIDPNDLNLQHLLKAN